MTTAREAIDQLLAAAATSDEVAALLLSGGFQGCPGRSRLCPVAVYLTATTGLQHTVVGGAAWQTGVYPEHIAGPVLNLPAPISTFVRWFDNNAYPALRMNDPTEDGLEQILGADHD